MIYGSILDSKASEHSARKTAMKNSTDNAGNIIDTLTIKYNRARQAANYTRNYRDCKWSSSNKIVMRKEKLLS